MNDLDKNPEKTPIILKKLSLKTSAIFFYKSGTFLYLIFRVVNRMKEELFTPHLEFLEISVQKIIDNNNQEGIEHIMEKLYITLYELRRNLNDLILNLPFILLARFTQILQTMEDNQVLFSTEVQEEIEMYFSYENIIEKVEKNRKVYWEDIASFYDQEY